MINIFSFLLIQFGLIIIILTIWLLRSFWIKNKKLLEIVKQQNEYLDQIYESVNAAEIKIKEIDQSQTFQSDDEIGWYFQLIKAIQNQLFEYTKFIK